VGDTDGEGGGVADGGEHVGGAGCEEEGEEAGEGGSGADVCVVVGGDWFG